MSDPDTIQRLRTRGWTVAVVESLTGGLLADRLARLPDASEWFRGAVVAYSIDVKRDLLGIGDAPPVSEVAVKAMASRGKELLGADLSLAVSGVGGPERQDGEDPGTVWFAVAKPGSVEAVLRRFDGSPEDVLLATCEVGFDLLERALR
jgi:nicotinamide-nucleotide amidase